LSQTSFLYVTRSPNFQQGYEFACCGKFLDLNISISSQGGLFLYLYGFFSKLN